MHASTGISEQFPEARYIRTVLCCPVINDIENMHNTHSDTSTSFSERKFNTLKSGINSNVINQWTVWFFLIPFSSYSSYRSKRSKNNQKRNYKMPLYPTFVGTKSQFWKLTIIYQRVSWLHPLLHFRALHCSRISCYITRHDLSAETSWTFSYNSSYPKV